MLPHSGVFLPVRDRGPAIVKIQTLGATTALLLTGPVCAQPAPHPDPVDAAVEPLMEQGHFPGMPIMPGVTIVEAMAQTAGVMIGTALDMADKELLIYFMSIDKCKFRRKVIPGDVLEMQVSTLRGKPGGKVWRFGGQATVEGDLAAEAEFTAMIDMPKG